MSGLDDGGSGHGPWFKRILSKVLGSSGDCRPGDLEREIQQMEDQGLIGPQEGEMIESLLEFGEILAREIMVPRTEIHALPHDATIGAVLEAVKVHGHSRFPVFRENIDHVAGVLHVKDLLPSWGADAVNLESLIRPATFVPETKKVTDLLAEMRKARSHMAVVVDEYGGTAGLLTIEDIIEEIVGEIQDEYDVEEPPLLVPLPEGGVLVDARLDVEDLAEYFDLTIPKDGFDTVGGFIFSLAGQVPRAGETVRFGDLELTVEEADERRIIKVKAQRLALADTA